MTRYMQLKLALSVIGLILLVWGIRSDDVVVRWIAIAFLAASVLMRFLPKRLRAGDYPRNPET
jgi:hypothetical protein